MDDITQGTLTRGWHQLDLMRQAIRTEVELMLNLADLSRFNKVVNPIASEKDKSGCWTVSVVGKRHSILEAVCDMWDVGTEAYSVYRFQLDKESGLVHKASSCLDENTEFVYDGLSDLRTLMLSTDPGLRMKLEPYVRAGKKKL